MAPRLRRRDLLAGLVGLPAVFAGCGKSRRPPLEGSIVGANESLGHRLRERRHLVVPSEQWQRAGVVIVGGGVAGLAAAWRLRRAGFEDFVLLELESRPGGTSRGDDRGPSAYPWGAHYLPVPMQENTALLALLEEMGILEGRDEAGAPIVAEQHLCRDPQERLYVAGQWHEGLFPGAIAKAEDEAQFAAFQKQTHHWAGWRDEAGNRAFAIPVNRSSTAPEVTQLDGISMAEWLDRHGLDSPVVRWMIDYACRDDYGLTVEQTSAWAGLFYFAARLQRPGAEPQPLMTWPDGNGRLVAHLYQQVAPRVRLATAAAEIIPNKDPDHPIDVIALASGDIASGFHAKQVIFAAPQFLAPVLIRGITEERRQGAAEFQYGSWLTANLFLTDRPHEASFPLAWDNVLHDSLGLGYVTATHQRGEDHGPTVWTYYRPFCDADPNIARRRLLELNWAECVELVLSDLEPAHPDLRPLVARADIMKWGHAMIRPRPGFIWGAARQRAARPFGAIHFAHSDLSGVALFEEAFYHGLRAAEEVLAARGALDTSLL